MRIVSVNIEGSRHLERVAALLDELEPDVVCVQELFKRDQKLITERYTHCAFASMTLQERDGHPYEEVGLGFASNEAFEPISHRYGGPQTLTTYIRSDETRLQRWLLGGVVDGTTIMTTHMMVTPDASIMPFQFKDAEAIIGFLEEHHRIIFCGDLNTPRTGPIFERFASVLIDTIPGEVTTTLDQQLHRSAPIHLVVDGAFVRGIEARTSLRFGVSDHAALIIETLE